MELDLARLPVPLVQAAREVARRLAEAGHRAWIVGGAARDLVRGEPAGDIDLVSAATPEEVERLFPRTVGVGRAFGIVIVIQDGIELELATFRAEDDYADGRRPERVRFGASLEQDAARRDFTCNAIYVDPLNGEVRDPTGGRADLAAGRLACVGDPRRRFAEDGLRILRLARFVARFDLVPEAPTLAAARASLDALRGVSPERVLSELTGILAGPAPVRAFSLLIDIGALARVLPIWAAASRADDALRLRALAALGPAPETLAGLALWLTADPRAPREAEEVAGLAQLEALRPSADLRTQAIQVWRLGRELAILAAPGAATSARVLALRSGAWRAAFAVQRAWRVAAGESVADLVALEAWRAARSTAELHPEPLLASSDLAASGVARGPRWGELLRAAERAQLDGLFHDRAGARAWLAAQLARP